MERTECKSQWDVKPPLLTTVSQDKLKKFEELKQRRKLVCGKSTEKRVNHIRQQATKSVLSEFYGADILQDVGYDDRSRAHSKRSRKRKRRQEDKSVELSTDNDTSKQKETEWQQLKQFLDPNPQLRGTTQGDDQPQSGLEERLEDAISEGNLNKATELSDTLADREFFTRVAGAFDCKQYLDTVKENEKQKKAKKQKLQWRIRLPSYQYSQYCLASTIVKLFDVKERWETKSNM